MTSSVAETGNARSRDLLGQSAKPGTQAEVVRWTNKRHGARSSPMRTCYVPGEEHATATSNYTTHDQDRARSLVAAACSTGGVEPHVGLAHAHPHALDREPREHRVRDRGRERLQQLELARRPRPRARGRPPRGSRPRPRSGRSAAGRVRDVEPEVERGSAGRRGARPRARRGSRRRCSSSITSTVRHSLHRRGDRERLDVLAHVVDTEDRGAAVECAHRGAEARGERCRRVASGSPSSRPSELLRESADEERAAELRDHARAGAAARGCARPSCRSRSPGRGRSAPRARPRRRRRAGAPRGRR